MKGIIDERTITTTMRYQTLAQLLAYARYCAIINWKQQDVLNWCTEAEQAMAKGKVK